MVGCCGARCSGPEGRASSKISRRSPASPYLLRLLPRATSRRWYAARVYASPHTLTASRYAARASHHQTPSLAPCSPCGVCGSSFSLANGFARAQRSYLHQHHELLPPPPRGRAAQRRAWRAPHVDRRQVRTIRRSSRCVALRVLYRSLSSLRAESGAERYFWQRQRQVNRYSRSRSRCVALLRRVGLGLAGVAAAGLVGAVAVGGLAWAGHKAYVVRGSRVSLHCAVASLALPRLRDDVAHTRNAGGGGGGARSRMRATRRTAATSACTSTCTAATA